jgi:Phage protein Gp138 N-terminal domain
MPGYLGKTNNWADDRNGLLALDERQAMWGPTAGKVVSFDPATQTATIQVLYKPKFNGEAMDVPHLEEVPIHFPRSGGGAITQPVKAGDFVSLTPQMRSTENYHSDEDGEASDARSFSLSDMEASIVGGNSVKSPIKNFDGANTHIRYDEEGKYGTRGGPTGTVTNTSKTTQTNAETNIGLASGVPASRDGSKAATPGNIVMTATQDIAASAGRFASMGGPGGGIGAGSGGVNATGDKITMESDTTLKLQGSAGDLMDLVRQLSQVAKDLANKISTEATLSANKTYYEGLRDAAEAIRSKCAAMTEV